MANKIKVTFLGTGSSIPTENRNHVSVHLKYKEQDLLFDCGEGTQRQFRKAKLNPMKVNRIFISHWHGDHTLGLPGLLQTMAMSGYNGTLEIHGPNGTKKKVKDIIENHMGYYLMMSKEDGYSFKIEAHEHKSGPVFENNDFTVNCFKLNHPMPTIGYTFELKDKVRIDKSKLNKLKLPNGPLLGHLIAGKDITVNGKKIKAKDITYTEPGKKISYALDTGYTKDLSKEVKDSELLIIESTYSSEEEAMANKRGHLTGKLAGKIAKEAKVKTLALVHLSQRYDRISKVIKDEAKEVFDGKVIAAKDFDTIEL